MPLRTRGTPPASPAAANAKSRSRLPAALIAGVAAAGLLAALSGSATAADHVVSKTPPAAATTAAAGQMSFDEQVQQQDQWCWAATGLSVAQFLGYGSDVDQNTFCDYARGLPAGSPCPNQPAELTDVQAGWQGTGMRNVGQVTGPISFDTVTQTIDAGSPVEVGIYWTAGGGHANVLYGYDASSQSLMYADPWPSNQRYGEMPHSTYVNNNQFRWGESLYGES